MGAGTGVTAEARGTERGRRWPLEPPCDLGLWRWEDSGRPGDRKAPWF